MKKISKRNLKALLLFAGILAFLSSAPAIAGSATSSVAISASVAANCTISTTTNIAFGAYDPLVANGAGGSDLTANGALSVACLKNTVARIALSQGASAAAGSTCSAPERQMANGDERLAYGFYQDAGLTTAWGCDNPGNDMSYAASSKAPVTKTIFGKISKNQDVAPGTYNDSVTAEVSF